MRCIQISLCILFSKKQTDYDAYEVVYASYFKRILLTTMHRPFSMRLKSLKSPKIRCIRRPRPHKQRAAPTGTALSIQIGNKDQAVTILFAFSRPCLSTASSLILYLRILPAAFIGKPSTKSTYLGILCLAM